jgi:serine/threonine-protein kinase HipA
VISPLPAPGVIARNTDPVTVCQLQLHDSVIGHLIAQAGGASALVFEPAYVASAARPTMTLAGMAMHPASPTLFANPWLQAAGLHPLLANLLPEAGLRSWLAQRQQISPTDEFTLLTRLGGDLPGALQVLPLEPAQIPAGVLDFHAKATALPVSAANAQGSFSLAGSQLKLPLRELAGRFEFADSAPDGNWIVKLPSAHHDSMPLNEYTVLKLAELAGISIPEIQLVTLAAIAKLPPLPASHETQGLVLRRFDRTGAGERIHAEDFAQALFRSPQDKFNCTAEVLGKVVYGFTQQGLPQVQQLARRLLVNVLLGNADTHLKNWSLLYPDRVNAELAPAYDLLYTQAFNSQEQDAMMTIGGHKAWYSLEFSHFEAWGGAVGVPWRAIRPHLLDTLERARTLWPAYLEAAPMLETHKLLLRHHWKSLPKKLQYGL